MDIELDLDRLDNVVGGALTPQAELMNLVKQEPEKCAEFFDADQIEQIRSGLLNNDESYEMLNEFEDYLKGNTKTAGRAM